MSDAGIYIHSRHGEAQVLVAIAFPLAYLGKELQHPPTIVGFDLSQLFHSGAGNLGMLYSCLPFSATTTTRAFVLLAAHVDIVTRVLKLSQNRIR